MEQQYMSLTTAKSVKRFIQPTASDRLIKTYISLVLTILAIIFVGTFVFVFNYGVFYVITILLSVVIGTFLSSGLILLLYGIYNNGVKIKKLLAVQIAGDSDGEILE